MRSVEDQVCAEIKEREHVRQCLIRELIRKYLQKGDRWMREYVNGWKTWEGLREDFWMQVRAGNKGEHGDWR